MVTTTTTAFLDLLDKRIYLLVYYGNHVQPLILLELTKHRPEGFDLDTFEKIVNKLNRIESDKIPEIVVRSFISLVYFKWLKLEDGIHRMVNGASQSSELQIDDRIVWISDKHGPQHGTVKWLGKLSDFGDKQISGIHFDNPVGSGTGCYNGQQLFETSMKHASFIPVMQLMKENDFTNGHGDGTSVPKVNVRQPITITLSEPISDVIKEVLQENRIKYTYRNITEPKVPDEPLSILNGDTSSNNEPQSMSDAVPTEEAPVATCSATSDNNSIADMLREMTANAAEINRSGSLCLDDPKPTDQPLTTDDENYFDTDRLTDEINNLLNEDIDEKQMKSFSLSPSDRTRSVSTSSYHDDTDNEIDAPAEEAEVELGCSRSDHDDDFLRRAIDNMMDEDTHEVDDDVLEQDTKSSFKTIDIETEGTLSELEDDEDAGESGLKTSPKLNQFKCDHSQQYNLVKSFITSGRIVDIDKSLLTLMNEPDKVDFQSIFSFLEVLIEQRSMPSLTVLLKLKLSMPRSEDKSKFDSLFKRLEQSSKQDGGRADKVTEVPKSPKSERPQCPFVPLIQKPTTSGSCGSSGTSSTSIGSTASKPEPRKSKLCIQPTELSWFKENRPQLYETLLPIIKDQNVHELLPETRCPLIVECLKEFRRLNEVSPKSYDKLLDIFIDHKVNLRQTDPDGEACLSSKYVPSPSSSIDSRAFRLIRDKVKSYARKGQFVCRDDDGTNQSVISEQNMASVKKIDYDTYDIVVGKLYGHPFNIKMKGRNPLFVVAIELLTDERKGHPRAILEVAKVFVEHGITNLMEPDEFGKSSIYYLEQSKYLKQKDEIVFDALIDFIKSHDGRARISGTHADSSIIQRYELYYFLDHYPKIYDALVKVVDGKNVHELVEPSQCPLIVECIKELNRLNAPSRAYVELFELFMSKKVNLRQTDPRGLTTLSSMYLPAPQNVEDFKMIRQKVKQYARTVECVVREDDFTPQSVITREIQFLVYKRGRATGLLELAKIFVKHGVTNLTERDCDGKNAIDYINRFSHLKHPYNDYMNLIDFIQNPDGRRDSGVSTSSPSASAPKMVTTNTPKDFINSKELEYFADNFPLIYYGMLQLTSSRNIHDLVEGPNRRPFVMECLKELHRLKAPPRAYEELFTIMMKHKVNLRQTDKDGRTVISYMPNPEGIDGIAFMKIRKSITYYSRKIKDVVFREDDGTPQAVISPQSMASLKRIDLNAFGLMKATLFGHSFHMKMQGTNPIFGVAIQILTSKQCKLGAIFEIAKIFANHGINLMEKDEKQWTAIDHLNKAEYLKDENLIQFEELLDFIREHNHTYTVFVSSSRQTSVEPEPKHDVLNVKRESEKKVPVSITEAVASMRRLSGSATAPPSPLPPPTNAPNDVIEVNELLETTNSTNDPNKMQIFLEIVRLVDKRNIHDLDSITKEPMVMSVLRKMLELDADVDFIISVLKLFMNRKVNFLKTDSKGHCCYNILRKSAPTGRVGSRITGFISEYVQRTRNTATSYDGRYDHGPQTTICRKLLLEKVPTEHFNVLTTIFNIFHGYSFNSLHNERPLFMSILEKLVEKRESASAIASIAELFKEFEINLMDLKHDGKTVIDIILKTDYLQRDPGLEQLVKVIVLSR